MVLDTIHKFENPGDLWENFTCMTNPSQVDRWWLVLVHEDAENHKQQRRPEERLRDVDDVFLNPLNNYFVFGQWLDDKCIFSDSFYVF